MVGYAHKDKSEGERKGGSEWSLSQTIGDPPLFYHSISPGKFPSSPLLLFTGAAINNNLVTNYLRQGGPVFGLNLSVYHVTNSKRCSWTFRTDRLDLHFPNVVRLNNGTTFLDEISSSPFFESLKISVWYNAFQRRRGAESDFPHHKHNVLKQPRRGRGTHSKQNSTLKCPLL